MGPFYCTQDFWIIQYLFWIKPIVQTNATSPCNIEFKQLLQYHPLKFQQMVPYYWHSLPGQIKLLRQSLSSSETQAYSFLIKLQHTKLWRQVRHVWCQMHTKSFRCLQHLTYNVYLLLTFIMQQNKSIWECCTGYLSLFHNALCSICEPVAS